MLWILLFVTLVSIAVYVVRKRLEGHASRINRYFLAAIAAWLACRDENARTAAIVAAKVADRAQRGTMLLALERSVDVLVVEAGIDREEMQLQIRQFAAEVSERDWTLSDLRSAKRDLGAVDPEYARALDRADPDVFTRRWPELQS